MLEDLIFALNFLCILLLGTLTSYEDAKTNRIQNRYVVYSLLLGIGTNILLPTVAGGFWYINTTYLRTTLINAILALVAGFTLWHFKIWRAGDGKLFLTYAFLLPLSTYYYGYVAYFPSFTILLNTLVPVLLLLFSNLWITTSNDEKYGILKNIMNFKQLFYMLLSFISAQWILSFLFRYLLPAGDALTINLLSILLLTLLMGRFQGTIYEASVPIAVLRLFLDYKTMLSLSFITNFLVLFALLVLVVGFITSLGSFRFNDRIRIMNLKPGLCCAERIVRKGKFYTTSASHEKADLLNLNYENLTSDDIRKLELLYREGKLKSDELVIKQTIPFAPFLFMGVLLTILVRGDVITYSRIILSRHSV